MATNTLGRNITFQIYNADGTPFHGLRMKKATVDSVIMSLGDKITGDVYYKDNTLAVTMQEYIEYKRNPNDANEQAVRYVLVNPPTIVREGIVSSNGDLNGMTKYSFEFYHPMYMLGNFPFSDVAVTLNEQRYLSENKSFHWIGNPNDYIAKLNKNLERTEWIVVKSERFPIDKDNELSDVLSFDNNTIADALKTMYDTWGIPYVVDVIKNGENYYNSGKRFKVVVGLPSNEIVDRQNQNYVFQMGKGVGLKNNSRTPRNNKIITRLSGYGSENNIPYGYPQIIWEGDARWEYTAYVNNDPMIGEDDKPHGTPTASAYPLYMGIVGGAYVKLIKHPFTRTHLMPSVYSRSVNKKVNPYAQDYDPTVELVDYYDAIATLDYPYPNEINPVAPSYEIHEFENVKPEMNGGQSQIAIVACVPVDNHRQVVDEWDDTIDDDGNYVQSYFQITLPVLSFDIYACAAITQEMQINMRSGACIGCTFPVQVDWDDYRKNFYDADGNFVPNGEQRDLNKYPKSNEVSINLILQKEYSTFGTIMPNIYQQPYAGDEFVVLGISLPIEYISNAEARLDDEMKSYMLENNVYYFDYPLKFDEFFLATHTSILAQLKPNCVVRFMFANEELQLYVKQLTVKFGNSPLPEYEITLTDNVEAVINQIGKVNDEVENLNTLISTLRQEYTRNVWSEIAKKLSRTNDDTAQGLITFLKGILLGTNGCGISSVGDATLNSVSSENFQSGELGGAGFGLYTDENGISTAEVDKLIVRMKAVFQELEIKKKSFTAGDVGFSDAANTISVVLPMDENGNVKTNPDGTLNFDNAEAFRVMWLADDGETAVYNTWALDDQARCQTFNIKSGVHSNVSNRYYWRKVLNGNFGTNATTFEWDGGEYNYIDLAANRSGTYIGIQYVKGCQSDVTNDVPSIGDAIIQIGNQTNLERQNYTEIIVNGSDAPAIKQFQGIDDYTLSEKLIRGDYYDPIKRVYKSVVYGDFYAGDKTKNGGYAEYDSQTNTFNVKGKLQVGSTLDDGRDVNELGVRKGNLLRNSGFTGNYESEHVTSTTAVSYDTTIYSDPFDFWQQTGCVAVGDSNSASGMSVIIGELRQTIDGGLSVGEWYTFSFRGQYGMATVSIGGVSKTFSLNEDLQRYDFTFECTANTQFVFTGNSCRVMELQLMAGNIPSEWHSAHKDNDSALAELYENDYIRNAIAEASTTINGGLILSQILKVGNYRNKQMSEETGGVSGVYTDEKSPFLWGGGTMEQAIYTIMKYAGNPQYQPTEEEVSRMAKFAVTHGGRAILNDIILRGYIYALGGVFNGTIYADKGVFNGIVTNEWKRPQDADGQYTVVGAGSPNVYVLGREDLSIMCVMPIHSMMSPEVAIEVQLPVSEYYIGKEIKIMSSVGSELVYEGFVDAVRVVVNTPNTENNHYIYGIEQYQVTVGSTTFTYYATDSITFDSGVITLVGAPYDKTITDGGQTTIIRQTQWFVKSHTYRIKKNGQHGRGIVSQNA